MTTKLLTASIGIVLLEILVYGYSQMMVPESLSVWQLASRYSARISFILFFLLQIRVYRHGFDLKGDSNSTFTLLLLCFGLNHFIHLGFLMTTVAVNNGSLNMIEELPQIITYGLLGITLLSIILRKNSGKHYQIILKLLFFLASFIFFITYVLRIFVQLPPASNIYVYYLLLAVSGSGLLLTMMAIFKGKSETLPTV